MKYTTPALVNNTKKLRGIKAFFFGQSTAQSYYKARHKTDDIMIMWIEASQFGKLQCFPCVLEEQGDPMVFEVMKGVNTKMRNGELVQRWPLFVSPQNISEYEVEEMSKADFFELFGEYRRKGVQKEIIKGEQDEEQSPAQLDAAAPEQTQDQPKDPDSQIDK